MVAVVAPVGAAPLLGRGLLAVLERRGRDARGGDLDAAANRVLLLLLVLLIVLLLLVILIVVPAMVAALATLRRLGLRLLLLTVKVA